MCMMSQFSAALNTGHVYVSLCRQCSDVVQELLRRVAVNCGGLHAYIVHTCKARHVCVTMQELCRVSAEFYGGLHVVAYMQAQTEVFRYICQCPSMTPLVAPCAMHGGVLSAVGACACGGGGGGLAIGAT